MLPKIVGSAWFCNKMHPFKSHSTSTNRQAASYNVALLSGENSGEVDRSTQVRTTKCKFLPILPETTPGVRLIPGEKPLANLGGWQRHIWVPESGSIYPVYQQESYDAPIRYQLESALTSGCHVVGSSGIPHRPWVKLAHPFAPQYLESQFVPRKMGTVVPVFNGVMSHFLRYFGGSR